MELGTSHGRNAYLWPVGMRDFRGMHIGQQSPVAKAKLHFGKYRHLIDPSNGVSFRIVPLV